MSKDPRILVAVALILGLGLGLPSNAAFSQESQGGAVKANLDLPFDALGESDDEEEAPEVIVFYSQQFEGDGFFYSCDISSSMAGNKLKQLQREVIKNVSQFSEKVQFSFCFFDQNLKKFPTSGRPADANPAMKAAGIAMVMSIASGYGSCSKASLLAALQFANQSSAKRKVIIHLADGHNTCPGNEESVYAQQTLAEVSAKNTQRVKINTICIGADADENWMRKLAFQNNGQASRVQ